MTKIAIIRIRGVRRISPRISKTLELLRLNKPNHCVVVEDTPQTNGMINVVKDYVAYGKIEEKTLFLLFNKRGTKGSNKIKDVLKASELKDAAKKVIDGTKVSEYANPVFRLKPPRKGYKDIKHAYPVGDLGKRDDINLLLKRMM